MFIGFDNWGDFLVKTFGSYDSCSKITIDTTKNQPCIYACMREGLEVRVEYDGQNEIFDFNYEDDKADFLIHRIHLKNIKSIKILDLDKMEGVEVT